MNFRYIRITISSAFILILASSFFVSAAFASPRPSAGGGCSGDTCTGYDIGGGGTYLAGNGGSGDLAGYSAVRLDAFRPDPQLITCNNPSRSRFQSLGIPTNSQGPFYVHHRVAISRSDNTTVVGGIPGATLWDKGVDWNANTGATRPTQVNPSKGPTHSNPWVGPRWQASRTYCLPLTGGSNIRADLAAAKPTMKFTPSDKAIVGMKKATLEVSVSEESKAGVISIGFTLEDYTFLAYRKVVDKKGKEVLDENGKPTWKGFNIKDPKSPIYIKEMKSDPNSPTNTISYSVKFKKKGEYIISPIATFKGVVIVNGVRVDGGTITTIGTQVQELTVVDVKSVNRNTKSGK